MRVRVKGTSHTGWSSAFNTHAVAEVIVGFEDGDCDSMFTKDLDVFVNDQWKDMNQAFKDRDIVPNNYNTDFGVPTSEENKARGYND